MFEQEEELMKEDEKEEIFYLFDINEPLFDIFKIVRHYFNETYSLGAASALIIRLIDDLQIPLKEGLELLPYIHSGYLTIILDAPNGK